DTMGPSGASVSAGMAGMGGGSGALGFANNIDPDSYFGFAAKVESLDYRLLGIRPMLASVHAASSPEKPCEFDGGRTVCPENWEMRVLYVIEATARGGTLSRRIGGGDRAIPKRILYIDTEGCFITASDQYDLEGRLWKTIATFNTYKDRPVPDARVAIYPYKRMFQTALVDEDVQSGFSSVMYLPGHESEDHECWYINMGMVSRDFINPHQMAARGH